MTLEMLKNVRSLKTICDLLFKDGSCSLGDFLRFPGLLFFFNIHLKSLNFKGFQPELCLSSL